MAILWERGEHVIVVDGVRVTLDASRFPTTGTDAEAEAAVKAYCENALSLSNRARAVWVHVFSRPTALTPAEPLHYLVRVAPVGHTPRADWWEPFPDPPTVGIGVAG